KTETIAAATAAPNMNCRKPPIRAHLHVALPFRPGGGLDGSQVSMPACGAELVDLPRERSLTSRPPSGTHLPTPRWSDLGSGAAYKTAAGYAFPYGDYFEM